MQGRIRTIAIATVLVAGLGSAAAWADADPPDAPPEDSDVTADITDTVIVWARPFARFDDTRWHVRSEVVTPIHVLLGTQKTPLRARAWQLEAVIACTMADDRGRLREADCRIEDAAVRVHMPGRTNHRFEAAVEATRERLVDARIQLQVNDRGAVPNLDLEDIDTRNIIERQLVVGARTLVGQISSAFHLNIPKGQSGIGENWVTFREPLMGLASPRAGLSSVQVANRIDPLDGHFVWQALGKAVSTGPTPHPKAGLPCFGDCPQPNYPEYDFENEYTYRLDYSSVAILDLGRGYPTERVWSVHGNPTASSPGTLRVGTYWSAGTMRQIEPDDTVDLGGTGLIGPPGQVSETHPTWVSVSQ